MGGHWQKKLGAVEMGWLDRLVVFYLVEGEIWQRFEGVTVYMEDEDYPEGDLIEAGEDIPAGLVCWQGKNGTVPEDGDVFRVLDGNNQVIFEETISGEAELFGKKYASAVKEGELTRDLLLDMEYALKGNMGDTFGNNLLNYVELENGSHMDDIKHEEKIPFVMRGIPFFMIVDERETHSPCKLTFYEADGMHIHGYERELEAGDRWYEVKYKAVSDEGPAMCVGWGVGDASGAAHKIREILDGIMNSFSLDGRLDVAVRQANAIGAGSSKSEHEKLLE